MSGRREGCSCSPPAEETCKTLRNGRVCFLAYGRADGPGLSARPAWTSAHRLGCFSPSVLRKLPLVGSRERRVETRSICRPLTQNEATSSLSLTVSGQYRSASRSPTQVSPSPLVRPTHHLGPTRSCVPSKRRAPRGPPAAAGSLPPLTVHGGSAQRRRAASRRWNRNRRNSWAMADMTCRHEEMVLLTSFHFSMVARTAEREHRCNRPAAQFSLDIQIRPSAESFVWWTVGAVGLPPRCHAGSAFPSCALSVCVCTSPHSQASLVDETDVVNLPRCIRAGRGQDDPQVREG